MLFQELDRMMADALINPSTGRGIQGKYEPPSEVMLKFGLGEAVKTVAVTPSMKISTLAELAGGVFGKRSIKLVFEGKTLWKNGTRKGPETLVEHRIPNKAKIHVLE